MSFDDLPRNWPDLPIDTHGLAPDVIDLLLRESDRRRDAFLALPCDEDGLPHSTGTLIFLDTDWRCTALDRQRTLTSLAALDFAGVVLAISSWNGVPDDVAQRWHRTADRVLGDRGVALLAMCSADHRSVRELPLVERDDAFAMF